MTLKQALSLSQPDTTEPELLASTYQAWVTPPFNQTIDLLDWPGDLLALTDGLRVDRFALLGVLAAPRMDLPASMSLMLGVASELVLSRAYTQRHLSTQIWLWRPASYSISVRHRLGLSRRLWSRC